MAKVCNHRVDFMSFLPRIRLRCNSCFRKKPGYLTESSIYSFSSKRRSPNRLPASAENTNGTRDNSSVNAQQICSRNRSVEPVRPPPTGSCRSTRQSLDHGNWTTFPGRTRIVAHSPMDPVEEEQGFRRLAITGRTSDPRYLPKEALIMKVYCRRFAILAGSCLLAVSALGEAMPAVPSNTAVEEKGVTLTETYEGSADTDVFISDINSSAGYVFNPHFSINMGVSYLFINPSTSKTGTTSASGMGNPSLGFRYSTKGPMLDFSTAVNGAFPVASSAKWLSTGRVTFDWDNHFAHGFDLFTPFFDVGVANSVPDTRFLKRPYTSLDTLAHFEGGSELDLGDKFSYSASA